MSYKTSRIYDFKPLETTFDFSTLVNESIHALSAFNTSQQAEGYIGCDLILIYPDLNMVDSSKGGWSDRVERLTEKIHKRFSDVDWELTTLRGNMFNVLDFRHDLFPHKITTAVRKGKYQLQRSIQISVPLRESFLSTTLILRMLLQMITPDWFQYADSARLRTWTLTPDGTNEVVVHDDTAKRVSWQYWLWIDNYSEAMEYFRTEGVAKLVADECRGYFMNADKAEFGERRVRRYLYPDGKKTVLSVNTADDVIQLVEDENFHAFYSSSERLDGTLGKVCLDIDARWMLSTILGPDETWNFECALVDAFLAMAFRLGLPIPAIKFSGARGIHVYWLIEPDAIDAEWIDIEPYVETMFRVDRLIDKKKTTEEFLRPFQGMKTLLQAFVLASKNRLMDWSRINLTKNTLAAMGIQHPTQLVTMGGMEDRYMAKIAVDVLSQRKGVFRSIMSPHYKSGLVSRNIRNELGQIGTQFRVWYNMRQLASIRQAMNDMLMEPTQLCPDPGTLDKVHLTQMADTLRSEVYMVVKFSPASASKILPEYYEKYRFKYSHQANIDTSPTVPNI